MALSENELELNDLAKTRQKESQGSTQESCNGAVNCTENTSFIQGDLGRIRNELGKVWCFFTFAGLFFYLADISSDIYVAVDLYLTGMKTYFIWTLIFIIPSSLVTNVLSLMLYYEASKNKNAPKIRPIEWVFRVIVCCIQLGPSLRYIDTFRYGRRAKKETSSKEKWRMFDAMTYERADVTLIRLLECFLEAAPQMVLQIYIMIDPDTSNSSLIAKFVCCAISLAAFSFSIVSQQRAMRASQDADVMSWTASFVQFSSYACLILSRVVTFGLFASHSLWSLFIICIIHCAAMTTWIFCMMKTELSEKWYLEMFFKFLFGVAYIFCYINLENTDSRWCQTVFHLVTFFENVGLILFWCMTVDTNCKYFILLLVIISYIVGLILSVTYYKIFHPHSEKIKPVYCCWPEPSQA